MFPRHIPLVLVLVVVVVVVLVVVLLVPFVLVVVVVLGLRTGTVYEDEGARVQKASGGKFATIID